MRINRINRTAMKYQSKKFAYPEVWGYIRRNKTASSFESYTQSQKVLYTRELKDTDNAEVDTKIVTRQARNRVYQLQTETLSTKNGNVRHRIMKEKTAAE
jgi:hypothetical protein